MLKAKCSVALACLTGATHLLSIQAGDISVGPLAHEFELTLSPGQRREMAGPFYSYEEREGQRQWALSPLFSVSIDPEQGLKQLDVLYPLFYYREFGSEYFAQFAQLLTLAGGQRQPTDYARRFSLFPFYFQQRSDNPEENYTALLPFYGRLKNRLFRDDIRFVMFPLYVQTGKRGAVTDNYLLPFFHLRHGDGLSGWQLWPLLGHEVKAVTSRTNGFGDVEISPGHEKTFGLWPVYFNEKLSLGTDSPQTNLVFFPFYTQRRSPARDSTVYLWPFFSFSDDRVGHIQQWGVPWPFLVFARGEGKRTDNFWPFYGHTRTPATESEFILWPLYKVNRLRAPLVERERVRVLFNVYSDLMEKNLETGKEKHRTALWPLFTARREANGNERLQLLALLEPFLPENKGIERNWSPLWSLWRSEKNAETGAHSQSFLWNLYRLDKKPGLRKCSLFFGLFQYQSGPEGRRWRVFYLPLATRKDSALVRPAAN